MKKITVTAAAAAALLALTGAQGGCGSSGRTVTVPGTTNATVTCSEIPYDYSRGLTDKNGSGISVVHGLVRGSLMVSCTYPGPDTWTITVTLLRNGVYYGKGITYTGLPNSVGYEAYVFESCTPGVYRLQYRYRWTLAGVVQADTTTVAINRTVTQHDCDA